MQAQPSSQYLNMICALSSGGVQGLTFASWVERAVGFLSFFDDQQSAFKGKRCGKRWIKPQGEFSSAQHTTAAVR
jgi:hypothetical protein